MFDNDSQNYYEVLDIKPDATQAEIRNAYFRVKSAYSKDSAALYSIFDEQETQLVLEKIEQAYLVLSNSEKRKEYDKLHGLLSHDFANTSSGSSSTASNTFSFSTPEETNAAEEAAQNVLGGGSDIFGDTTPTKPTTQPQRTFYNEPDYSTPRTLQEGTNQYSQKSSPDYSENTNSFKPYENKLGIVRRIDLIKMGANPELENLIGSETEYRGDFFKRVRELRGISIDELAEFTKISKHYLTCLESEEYENLPAAVYVRGFISQVAKALKIPTDKATQNYMNHYKQAFTK